MNIVVTDDYDRLSAVAADVVTEVVKGRPDASIVAATGKTPGGLYEELANRSREGTFDGTHVRLFQLDEYVGVDRDDRRSLFGWLARTVAGPWGVPHEAVVGFAPDGDHGATCASYEAAVDAADGFDLAILGIGANGHLGFNEPPSAATAPTRVVHLAPESIGSNAGYWGPDADVPETAFTAGMNRLLSARRILLVASGTHKRGIVHRALHGPVTPQVPASWLQSAEDVTAVVDRAAWSEPASTGGGDG